MPQREANRRPNLSCSTAADRVHNHQYGTTARREQSVQIFRSSCLLDTKSSKVLPHRGD